MNKYEALQEWLENYAPLNNWIYFNATTMESGNASVQTIQSEREVNKFNDGTREVEFLFAIAMVTEWDAETSTTNVDAIAETENFTKWIETQYQMPTFSNAIVNEIVVMDSVPTLSVDNDQNLAKYQFNCKMNYLEGR